MTGPVDTLRDLVAFETVSSRPVGALAGYVAERLERIGLTVEHLPSPTLDGKVNLLASAGPPGTDGLVLSGHMDVVPTEGQPWRTDPFALHEHDGRLYGRGTADMKGFLAATLHALERIDVRRLRKELVLLWTHDEEVGCLGSAQLVARWDPARPLPRACLIGEPTDFRVLRMHPGHVAVEIALTGRAAHSSRPDLGINAIEAAATVVGAVRALARELEGERAHEDLLERPWVAVNTGVIHGGTAVNIVPDRCVVQLGYRQLPGTPDEAVFERLRARLDALDLGGAGVAARITRITPSLLTPEGTVLQDLLAPYASSPRTGAASFATDGGNLARLGLQPLVFGPGSIEVAHQADEYLETAALIRAVDVVEDVIRRRCG